LDEEKGVLQTEKTPNPNADDLPGWDLYRGEDETGRYLYQDVL